MLVSVIVPSYNQGMFLAETLESILSQDYSPIEIILMDGGSTDSTLEVIAKYAARLTYWESQKDRGQSHALNKGYERCRGEVVTWLCSDDTLLPKAISTAVQEFQANENVGAVLGHAMFTDTDSKPLEPFYGRYTSYADLVRFWNGRVQVPQPALFLRRATMARSPYFLDESLHHAMDYDLWCRILEGVEVRRVDQFFATYRRHPEAKTTASKKWRDEKLIITRRFWPSHFSLAYWQNYLSCTLTMRKIYSDENWDRANQSTIASERISALKFFSKSLAQRPTRLLARNTYSMAARILVGDNRYNRFKTLGKSSSLVK